jgi:hypothetical protein
LSGKRRKGLGSHRNELPTRIVTGRTWRNLEEHLDHAGTFDSPDARDCFYFGF